MSGEHDGVGILRRRACALDVQRAARDGYLEAVGVGFGAFDNSILV
jgi:hypothetical protein